MKRRQAILAAAAVILGIAALVVFWPVREDLSDLKDAGEPYDARILRDTWGVPHVFGRTDADAAYGLAYAHAEDDFLTIQQALAAARGRLAEIYGMDAAPNDYMVHLLRIWDVVEANYETTISAEERAVVEAYAAGLNHYAALHPDEALPGLFPVSGKDVVAGFVHRLPLFFGIDQTLVELFAEERQRPVSQKAASGRPTTLAENAFDLPPAAPYGSNTFSVGPTRSADGSTFLAVNSHQPWEGIAAWYEAHVHSEEGWDMAGGLLPGSPTITHGHNRDLGWAFTVNSPDLVDVYVLDINPDNPNQYRFDGEWLELEARQVPITVRLIGRLKLTVKREALWSVYGPAVRQDHGVYAVRFAGMGRVGHVEQFLRLNKARTLAEWQDALAGGPLPMFNVGYADREGNIYYVYNGLLPARAEGYDWEQYLPGDTSETLWTEYLAFEQLPQVLNPPSGFIQNANSSPFQTTFGPGNPDPVDFSPTLGVETAMSNRALRLLELFAADESITAEEFQAYKYDMAYSQASYVPRMVQTLRAQPPPDDPNVRAALDLLAGWDLQTDPDNRVAALVVLTLNHLYEAGAYDLNPSKLVDVDVPTEALVAALEEAVFLLMEEHGRIDPPWSEVNRLRRGEVDLGLGGAPDTPHAIYGELEENGRFRGIAGDSYVMLVSWDAAGKVSSRSIHQYGSATLDESSPHYADQAPLFAARDLKPVWFDEADIRANLEQEYRPGEELP